MHKLLITTIVAGAALAASAAHKHQHAASSESSMGGEKYFAKAYVGAGFPNKLKVTGAAPYTQKSKTSVPFGVAVGYMLDKNFAAGVDMSYRATSYKANETVASAKVKNFITMLTGAYRIGHYGDFSPYATAGVGYSRLKATKGATGKKNDIAAMAGLGVAYKIDRSMCADLSYRFLSVGKFSNTKKLYTQEVLLGLGYKF